MEVGGWVGREGREANKKTEFEIICWMVLFVEASFYYLKLNAVSNACGNWMWLMSEGSEFHCFGETFINKYIKLDSLSIPSHLCPKHFTTALELQSMWWYPKTIQQQIINIDWNRSQILFRTCIHVYIQYTQCLKKKSVQPNTKIVNYTSRVIF